MTTTLTKSVKGGLEHQALAQIEKRIKVLERTVHDLAQSKRSGYRKWYRTHAGRFTNDPVFEEIVRLGRAYRKSQPPSRSRD
jgi:hypothetical protein